MTAKSVNSSKKIGTTIATLGTMALVLALGMLGSQSTPMVADAHTIQGCTPGFWKNHLDAWQKFSPDDKFSEVFGFVANDNPDLTLLQALNLGGSAKPNLLYVHGTAALLNAAHEDIFFRYSESTVISKVNLGVKNDFLRWETQKDHFEAANEMGCPL